MKIRVLHRDGTVETLTLTGEWTCVEARIMAKLQQGGFEHFFTSDGYYDGWGGNIEPSPEDAASILRAMESKRQIKRLGPPPKGLKNRRGRKQQTRKQP